jgi:3-deoxy-D-manno-octulosonate 8-phosphate phosphatase KdsC-like HAD superfamily phosphatase
MITGTTIKLNKVAGMRVAKIAQRENKIYKAWLKRWSKKVGAIYQGKKEKTAHQNRM